MDKEYHRGRPRRIRTKPVKRLIEASNETPIPPRERKRKRIHGTKLFHYREQKAVFGKGKKPVPVNIVTVAGDNYRVNGELMETQNGKPIITELFLNISEALQRLAAGESPMRELQDVSYQGITREYLGSEEYFIISEKAYLNPILVPYFCTAAWLDAGKKCYYCQRELYYQEITLDHYIPLLRGGTNLYGNMRCACDRCNAIKGAMLPDAFQKVLRSTAVMEGLRVGGREKHDEATCKLAVGMEQAEGIAYLKSLGYEAVVAVVNQCPVGVFREYVPGRLHLDIGNGRIVRYWK